MHIGFDVSQTGAHKAGCGHFAHAMLDAMLEANTQHRFSLYPSFGDFYFDVNMPAANPYPAPQVDYGPRHGTLEQAKAFWNARGLEDALGRPDIVHSNNFWCPTQLRSSRLVYTLHDLSFLVDPSWSTEVNREGCWAGVRRSAMHADWIAAVSQASRSHYLRTFPDFPPERIRVVYPCSRFSDFDAQGLRPAALHDVPDGRYWLNVGTIEPRKNQRRIAEAYARWREATGRGEPLVFAGGSGWLMEDFARDLDRLAITSHVILTGYVSDAELTWLYRNCLGHVYVSHFEGFGLPVLEGMQFGAPTIASNSTSIPEVAGDAAVLIEPTDTRALVDAMVRLSGNANERAHLSRAGRERAALFTGESSAAELLRLYADAVRSEKRATRSGAAGWGRRLMRYGGRLYERAMCGRR